MHRTYSPPTLRQLGRGELTEAQREWLEGEIAQRRVWSPGQVVAVVVAAAMAVVAIALVVFVASLVAGCGVAPNGFGESTADVCREALAHRDARAHACGDASTSDQAQCDSVVWIPHSESVQEDCFRALDALDCKALRTMPDACVGLFPPW